MKLEIQDWLAKNPRIKVHELKVARSLAAKVVSPHASTEGPGEERFTEPGACLVE